MNSESEEGDSNAEEDEVYEPQFDEIDDDDDDDDQDEILGESKSATSAAAAPVKTN